MTARVNKSQPNAIPGNRPLFPFFIAPENEIETRRFGKNRDHSTVIGRATPASSRLRSSRSRRATTSCFSASSRPCERKIVDDILPTPNAPTMAASVFMAFQLRVRRYVRKSIQRCPLRCIIAESEEVSGSSCYSYIAYFFRTYLSLSFLFPSSIISVSLPLPPSLKVARRKEESLARSQVMAQFAFYLVPVASSSFTIAVRTLLLLLLLPSLLVLAGVSSYRCACRQPADSNPRTIIIVVRRVDPEKEKALINANNVDEFKPYSARRKFSGVLVLTVRNTKYLSCKIVVEKRSVGCHVAGHSGSSNGITWRARASNNGV
ncbi:hypothetical protein ALC57_04752 [Trachymyrmex cornetzi]|uniref:Uncharacterized protein n=1 Tax=Trachymyrmex cornetzi TaxID=471704 RepID=A0A195EDP8_9HYME|nr:hypothetical protein ALC57_04752 [Trachymyrmex cornetzi]